MKRPTILLNDAFPQWLTGNGIFKALAALNVPWIGDVESDILDVDYFGNHSGRKVIAPLLYQYYVQNNSPALTEAQIQFLAKIAISRYGKNWKGLYDTLSLEYNPINNYDMTETENLTGTNTGTVTNSGSVDYGKKDTHTTSGTDTQTISGTTTPNTTTDTTRQIYAFDSSNWENSERQTENQSGTVTTENTVNDSKDETLTIQSEGSDSNENTRTDNLQNTLERTLKRSGNIGVTTSQQMIQSERELWLWKFFDIVYADIDELLTINVYPSIKQERRKFYE